MSDETEALIKALRELPAPEPRPGFVDQALAKATGGVDRRRTATVRGPLPRAMTRWETWFGAALGAAATAALAVLMLRPITPGEPPAGGLTLALNETREIDVLIESERRLEDAAIRIVVSGGVALDGFEDERELDWRTTLEAGGNLLSLPVVARDAGAGRLVAVIEHEGRTRTVTVNLTVRDAETSRS